MTVDNGCMQSWKIQVCVCSGQDNNALVSDLLASSTVPPPPTTATLTPMIEAPVMQETLEHIYPCFLIDAQYKPLNMPGRGRTLATSAERCQSRCTKTPGCAHFTWWP